MQALSVWTGEKVRHYMLFYDEVRENMSFVSYAPSPVPLLPSYPATCFSAPCSPAPLTAAAHSLALISCLLLPSFLSCLSLFSCPFTLNIIQSFDPFVCSVGFQSLGYALDPEGERFADMKDLLRHYYKFNLPRCDVKLTRPYK